MSNVTPFKKRGPTPVEILESIDMLRGVSERARAMGLGLAAYPVEDVENVLSALSLRMKLGAEKDRP